MKLKIIVSFVILGLFIQCKGEHKPRIEKVEKISAENIFNFYGNSSLKFQLFSDSSYIFTIREKKSKSRKNRKIQ